MFLKNCAAEWNRKTKPSIYCKPTFRNPVWPLKLFRNFEWHEKMVAELNHIPKSLDLTGSVEIINKPLLQTSNLNSERYFWSSGFCRNQTNGKFFYNQSKLFISPNSNYTLKATLLSFWNVLSKLKMFFKLQTCCFRS